MSNIPPIDKSKNTFQNDPEKNSNDFLEFQDLKNHQINSINDKNQNSSESEGRSEINSIVSGKQSDISQSEKGFSKWSSKSSLSSNPDLYLVVFDGPNDPMNPQNWPRKKKLFTTVILLFTTFVSVFTSSIFSTVTSAVASEYNVSNEVGILGLSLFVLGFAFGPNVWAPLSELKGRRPVLVWSRLGFSIFQIGTAMSKDIQTTLICRFWGGVFGAALTAVVSGAFVDMYNNRTRGIVIVLLYMVFLISPLVAPFIGGFITESRLGWRWTQWLTAILGFASFFLNLFFLDESFAPVILVEKAMKLRLKTQNWAIHAKHEELEINLKQLLNTYFSRPVRMLLKEPILLLFSFYISFIYGLLYLFLTAYPIVFEDIHGMSPGVSGLPYFGMIFGMILGGTFILLSQPSYSRKLADNNDVNIPEWRLPPMMAGSIAFAVGLFSFAWTGYKSSIHWIVPTLSGIPTGFGLIVIFIQSVNYLVDTYLKLSASALAGSSLLRSLAGAGFPLFSGALFSSLGINWGGSVLGLVSALLVPVPIIFYKYGSFIRARSPHFA